MSVIAAIHAWDWVVVGAYAGVVVWFGWMSQRRQKSAADYMLGGRRLPWWAIGISIIATSFSSITMLGAPDTAYTQNWVWWQLQLGDLIAVVLVCAIFLPFFAKLNATTAYEYLEGRFGKTARRLASVIFHITELLRAGPILFATAAAGAHVCGIGPDQVPICIIVIGLAAMAYSSIGGLGAVVWTDTIQMLLVIVGISACVLIALGDLPDGLDTVSAAIDKTKAPVLVDPDPDPSRFPTLLTSILGYGVLAFSVFGTNQKTVQRYLACSDVSGARRAAMLGWGVGALVVALTMGLGVVLNAWYGGVAQPAGEPILSRFIADRVPVGLAGMLVAAILAAAMSSMDSTIHSMSTATLVDFVEPLRREPMGEAARLKTARALTWVYGVLAVGVALYAQSAEENVLKLVVRWLAYIAGPMLALFLLAILTERVREWHAVTGVLAGYAVALGINDPAGWVSGGPPLKQLGLHPIWTSAVSFAVAYGVAILLSLTARGSPSTGASEE